MSLKMVTSLYNFINRKIKVKCSNLFILLLINELWTIFIKNTSDAKLDQTRTKLTCQKNRLYVHVRFYLLIKSNSFKGFVQYCRNISISDRQSHGPASVAHDDPWRRSSMAAPLSVLRVVLMIYEICNSDFVQFVN